MAASDAGVRGNTIEQLLSSFGKEDEPKLEMLLNHVLEQGERRLAKLEQHHKESLDTLQNESLVTLKMLTDKVDSLSQEMATLTGHILQFEDDHQKLKKTLSVPPPTSSFGFGLCG